MSTELLSYDPCSTTLMTTILIVDDHPAIREALSMRISEQPDLAVLGEAATVSSAMESVREQRPDVALVDITLTDGNGIELINALQAHDDSIRILVCSMHEEAIYAERAIRAGATGYISKEHATAEIVEAIRRVAAGKLYVSDKLADVLLHRSLGTDRRSAAASSVHLLSDREFQVFEMLAEAMDTVAIAEKMRVSPKTVETYRLRIKDKLGVQTIAELIRRAVEWSFNKSDVATH